MGFLLNEVSQAEADLVGLLGAPVAVVVVMVAGLWWIRRGGADDVG